MKRFWRTASVRDGGIFLDDRPLRTPAGVPLAGMGPARAAAIAREWTLAPADFRPQDLPLTGYANAAIDRILPDPAPFVAEIAAYGRSDLTCYRAGQPENLVARQTALWDPVLDWVHGHFSIRPVTTQGIMWIDQPPALQRGVENDVARFDGWALAGVSTLVRISGSVFIGLAVANKAITPEAGLEAALLDDNFQTEHWGEDPEATAHRAARVRDWVSAAHWLALGQEDSGQ